MHFASRGILPEADCSEDKNTCNIKVTIDRARYRIQVIHRDYGGAMAWRRDDAKEITLDSSDNKYPTENDRLVVQLCRQIDEGRFSDDSQRTRLTEDVPFRLCVHREQGISFQHPSEWEKVYEPDYMIYPSDARRVADGSGGVLISPRLTAIAGEKIVGTPREWFERFVGTFPHRKDLHYKFESLASHGLSHGLPEER